MLVAYFSASGVTAEAAWKLSEAAGAELYEINPEIPYSSLEMNDPVSSPVIAGKMEDMDQYEVVFVGFPIWWYSAPMAVFFFLEEKIMQYRKLPKGAEQISVLGIGTSSIQASGEEEIEKIVDAAIENGINFFDMASSEAKPFAAYGLSLIHI